MTTVTEKNITLRDASDKAYGLASRGNSFKVNASILKADYEENPRKDYGSDEEFNELVESIRTHGVLMPLTITTRGSELWVAHGFRRYKAIQVLLAEGLEVFVEVKQCQNSEEVLIQHLTLNSGKPLNDAEISETLLQLAKLIGADNYKDIAKRTGIEYQKVVKLMNYAKNASTQVKNAVKNGEVVLTNAIEFVAQTPEIGKQNAILEVAKSTPKILKNQKKKVVLPTKNTVAKKDAKNPAVEPATTTNNDDYSYLWKILEEADSSAFNTQLQKLLVAIGKNEPIEVLVKLID